MKHLKTYKIFEAFYTSGLTQKQEVFLNRYTNGTWSYDPATGLVNVQGNFNLTERRLKSLQGITFGDVSGYFNCSFNGLTSLEGAPQKVGGYFYCQNNNLTSLEGAPQNVRDFYCENNNLTSLEGAPQKVGRDFRCGNNNLTSLSGAPQKVGGDFACTGNNLTSLEGAPQKVGRDFSCISNNLTSLEGAPREVGGYFSCSYNKLTSLAGAPQKIGSIFSCDAFEMRENQWNSMGWVKDLQDMGLEAQKLLLTLLPAEELNKEIQKDPAGMVMKLKEIWNLPNFEKIKSKLIWPRGYEEKMDLVGGLNTLGF